MTESAADPLADHRQSAIADAAVCIENVGRLLIGRSASRNASHCLAKPLTLPPRMLNRGALMTLKIGFLDPKMMLKQNPKISIKPCDAIARQMNAGIDPACSVNIFDQIALDQMSHPALYRRQWRRY